jgi:hypothetical protein
MPDQPSQNGIQFLDLAKDVAVIKDTLENLKKIGDQLNKPRSVVCTVVNGTDLPISFERSDLDHGVLATPPPLTVAPRSAASFGAQSSSGALFTGTEGTVFYKASDGTSFRFHWDNPWAGSNGSDAGVDGPLSVLYAGWTITGGGDTNALMTLIAMQKMPTPFHDIWVRSGGATGTLGLPTGDFTPTPDGIGCFMPFERGSIYSSLTSGTHEVHGDIRTRWGALGWETGFLGYPVTDETRTPDQVGAYNHFQHGSIYWTAQTGAHEVHGDIHAKWAALGWETGFLGYPVTDETRTPDQVGAYNHFQHGSIYWTPQTGAHEVHGLIREKWAALGWEGSFLRYPLEDEQEIAGKRVSKFQGGRITYDPASGTVEAESLLDVGADHHHRDAAVIPPQAP